MRVGFNGIKMTSGNHLGLLGWLAAIAFLEPVSTF